MGQFTKDKTHRTCPTCGVRGEIEADFGWRKSPAGPIPCTYCRSCRRVQKREAQRTRRAVARAERLAANPPPPLPPDGHKRCSKCELVLPLSAFHGPRLVRGRERYPAACRACCKAYRDGRRSRMTEEEKEAQRLRDRESYYRNPATRRRQHLKQFYGITPEQFDALKLSQRGVCAICGDEERPGRDGVTPELSIDHDHSCCPESGRSCGRCIRGLLCRSCNQGIGFLRDSQTILTAASEYLRCHSE